MKKKQTKTSPEERRAERERYDETTRRLRERIDRGLAEIQARRERSSSAIAPAAATLRDSTAPGVGIVAT